MKKTDRIKVVLLGTTPILIGVEWRTLNSLCERDRSYLWAAGLFYVDFFAKELDSWDDDINYPSKRVEL